MERLLDLRILIADVHEEDGNRLREALLHEGMEAELIEDGDEALERLLEGGFDVLVSETVLHGLGGKELVEDLLTRHPGFPVILYTRYPKFEEAFDFAQMGVLHYLPKGTDVNDLLDRIHEIGSVEEEESEQDSTLRVSGYRRLPFRHYVSRNKETAEVFQTAIERVAKAPSTVLITGESGTGKE
ncbi:response regulator, partial [bacterium]|nr:response regulator [bacterium]